MSDGSKETARDRRRAKRAERKAARRRSLLAPVAPVRQAQQRPGR